MIPPCRCGMKLGKERKVMQRVVGDVKVGCAVCGWVDDEEEDEQLKTEGGRERSRHRTQRRLFFVCVSCNLCLMPWVFAFHLH